MNDGKSFGSQRTYVSRFLVGRHVPTSPLPVLGILLALFVAFYAIGESSPAKLGPPVALGVRYLYFPMLGVGVGAWFYSRILRAGNTGNRLQTLAKLFFFTPIVAVAAYGRSSIHLYLLWEAEVAVFPFVLAAVIARGAYRGARDGESRSRSGQAQIVLLTLGALIVGFFWSRPFLQDLWLPRIVVNGTVKYPFRHIGRRGPSLCYVTVNGHTYEVPLDVFSQLREDDHIHAEAGAGSTTILSMGAVSRDLIQIHCSVHDLDLDRPIAVSSVELSLFPLIHRPTQDYDFSWVDLGRSLGPCVPATQPILRTHVDTGANGDFDISLPVGRYYLRVTAPNRTAVGGCVKIASEEDRRRCGSQSGQRFFIRMVAGKRSLPADIVFSYPCARITGIGVWTPSHCAPLNLKLTVSSKQLLVVDDQGQPIVGAILEFHNLFRSLIHKGRGESIGTVKTGTDGRADLSSIYAQREGPGLDQVWLRTESGEHPLILNLGPLRSSKPQRLQVVRWQCGGQDQWQANTE